MTHGTQIRTAVILAAGMGIRLGEQGKLAPKGCLQLGQRSILEESIVRLLATGIERIVIVTGHLAEQFEPLRETYQPNVELVHNPHFADSGSMYSLYCARSVVEESFLLLESDLIYEGRALDICLDSPRENVTLLAGLSDTSDEVFVETSDGYLVAMSKNRHQLGRMIAGEFVGVCKVSHTLFSAMLAKAQKRFETTRHMDYETECLVAAAQDEPVWCCVVDDLCWCEIDDETHLARAQNEIYPALMSQEARVRS